MRQSSSLCKDILQEIFPPIMVSSCLLGVCCRYDARHSLCYDLVNFTIPLPHISFCPEELGGLPTPRPSANIIGGDGYDVLSGVGRVVNTLGKDVTDHFLKGAYNALSLAKSSGSAIAVMKHKSPSCGLETPYCDKPSGHGTGVTAALFALHGIRIFELDAPDPFPSQSFLRCLKEAGKI